MKALVFTIRALVATLLTGLVTPFLAATFWVLAAWLLDSRERLTPGFPFDLVGFFGLYGIIPAIPCAIVVAIVAESPKALWLSRKAGYHHLAGVALSLLAALAIPAAFVAWNLSNSADFEDFEAFGFVIVVGAFVIGGLCSAFFWWLLVLRRAAQTVNQPAH